MVLELAEHVEAPTGDAHLENRTARFHKRPPDTPICSARIRVESIRDDRVTPGAQYNSQALTEWGEARGVMHQCRLKSVIVLEASGIVKEWIGWDGGIQKRLVASNRSILIELFISRRKNSAFL